MFPAGGDPTDPSSSGDPASDPFAALMKAMQGGGEGGAGAFPGMPPGMGGFGEGQEPGSSLFPPGMMMPPSLEPEYSTKKTFADRMFTIAHLLGVLALVAFVIGWWEPRVMELKRAGLMDVSFGWLMDKQTRGVELVRSLVSSSFLFFFLLCSLGTRSNET